MEKWDDIEQLLSNQKHSFSEDFTAKVMDSIEAGSKNKASGFQVTLDRWFPRISLGAAAAILLLVMSFHFSETGFNMDTLTGVADLDTDPFLQETMFNEL